MLHVCQNRCCNWICGFGSVVLSFQHFKELSGGYGPVMSKMLPILLYRGPSHESNLRKLLTHTSQMVTANRRYMCRAPVCSRMAHNYSMSFGFICEGCHNEKEEFSSC